MLDAQRSKLLRGLVAPLHKAVMAAQAPALQPLCGALAQGGVATCVCGMQLRHVTGQGQAHAASLGQQGIGLAPALGQPACAVQGDAQPVQGIRRRGVGPEDEASCSRDIQSACVANTTSTAAGRVRGSGWGALPGSAQAGEVSR